MSKTKEAAAVGEVLRAHTLERCAELGKRGIGRLRIRRIGLYEEVHIIRKAGLRMKDNREPPTTRYLTPWAWKANKRSL